jgi:2-alkyl-3-oxoalkanoate reductase
MTQRDIELEAAYRASVYVIRDGSLGIETRIDEPNRQLAATLERHGVERAALITACNPDSRRLSDIENQTRQRQLKAELAAAEMEYLPAIGRAADGSWKEPSLLVLGIDRAAAMACARRWGQRAIVIYDGSGCGRLSMRPTPLAAEDAGGGLLPVVSAPIPASRPARAEMPPADVGRGNASDIELPTPSAEPLRLPEPSPEPLPEPLVIIEAVPAPAARQPDALPSAAGPLRRRSSGPTRVLVTGGGGFLGSALCRRLIERGYEVVSFARGNYPALTALGVRQLQGDLASFEAMLAVTEGVDAVFHVAAKAGAWGPFQEYFDANVRGTRNLLVACRMNGVRTLVHTSTPSVAHRGRIAVRGGDEQSAPVATRFKAVYPATKAVAERAVLAANCAELATVALRPRLIWGPGDNHLLPRLVERARAGRLRLVGGGRNRIDTTYIDNAVDAHLAAFDALHDHPGAACAGRAYFISNGEPRSVAEIINGLLRAVGAPSAHKEISFRTAYLAGAAAERIWAWLRLSGEPPMTRFIAEQLATAHWYCLAAAERDFGFKPRVSIDEGLARLKAEHGAKPT